MKPLLAIGVLLFAVSAFGQNYVIAGITEADVEPLLNVQDVAIQWNVSTFEGFVTKGKTKKDLCGDAPHCYSYDGRGNWRFNFTGTKNCQQTCTFVGTGSLSVGPFIPLPDGSATRQLSAVMFGTFTGQGNIYPNVMAIYYSQTAPSIDWPKFDVPVPVDGDFTVVLEDN
jgi:hypothetical protein